MKKHHGMMYPPKGKTTPDKCTCTKCGRELTPATAYYYVDCNNYAISKSAKPYCKQCYLDTYGRY